LLASTNPAVAAYDPAFAYEIAILIQDGVRRMVEAEENLIMYLTVHNEAHVHPAAPKGVREGVLQGLYCYKPAAKKRKLRAQLLGSGSIICEVLRAQELLEKDYRVAADVWSATSYSELRREALSCERWNTLHPESTPRVPRVAQILEGVQGPVIAASDNMMAVPDQIARWVPGGMFSLGTDGFGRSDTRPALRRHFEIDAEHIVIATLKRLSDQGAVPASTVAKAIADLGVDAEKPDPAAA
jgi:pyruvate dehydrogenase E1 component